MARSRHSLAGDKKPSEELNSKNGDGDLTDVWMPVPWLFFNSPHPGVADLVVATTTPNLTVLLSLAARRRHQTAFPSQRL